MAHNASLTAQKRKCPDEEETAAGLCANGCGFFGAAATGNMCSKCYRDHAMAAAASVSSGALAAASTAPPEKKAKMTTVDDVPSAAAVAADDPSVPCVKQANRCASCRKKVGLLGFRCRCEATFCSVHRYTDKHDCGFDYKAAGQEKIAKQNPTVIADKIARRI